MELNWTNDAEEFDALLERWRGAQATALAYSNGHGVFVLALRRQRTFAYLQFKDCQSLLLYRMAWKPFDATISRTNHRLGVIHTFSDPGNIHLESWAAFGAESSQAINVHDWWSSHAMQ